MVVVDTLAGTDAAEVGMQGAEGGTKGLAP